MTILFLLLIILMELLTKSGALGHLQLNPFHVGMRFREGSVDFVGDLHQSCAETVGVF
jgi:hypothetical protein